MDMAVTLKGQQVLKPERSSKHSLRAPVWVPAREKGMKGVKARQKEILMGPINDGCCQLSDAGLAATAPDKLVLAERTRGEASGGLNYRVGRFGRVGRRNVLDIPGFDSPAFPGIQNLSYALMNQSVLGRDTFAVPAQDKVQLSELPLQIRSIVPPERGYGRRE
jgi:hypothetical protein